MTIITNSHKTNLNTTAMQQNLPYYLGRRLELVMFTEQRLRLF